MSRLLGWWRSSGRSSRGWAWSLGASCSGPWCSPSSRCCKFIEEYVAEIEKLGKIPEEKRRKLLDV